jgi:uncharacterized protein (DUF58 family)
MRGLPSLPVVPPRFPEAFRIVLHEVLARGARLSGARQESQRARRSALSQSGTFVGHRPYVRGDDLRAIDWSAYARSGELFVKQFEEEERRTATLLLDLSASLLAGSPPRRLFAMRLAAVIGGMALRHLDGLTVLAPGAGARAFGAFQGAADLDRLLAHLDELPVAASRTREAMELLLQRSVAGRVHWLSDFVDPSACEVVLAAVRRRGGHVTGWLPAIGEDTVAPKHGYVRVADPETGEAFAVAIDRALADEMQRQLDSLRRRQDRLFAQCGCPLVRWVVPNGDALHLSAYQELATLCSR